MPVRRRGQASPQRSKLKQQLVDEYNAPNEDADEPLIIIDDAGTDFTPIQIFVVWSEWEGLSEQERSAIIMDFFRDVAEEPLQITRVTIAMGLTPAEADRMGIEH